MQTGSDLTTIHLFTFFPTLAFSPQFLSLFISVVLSGKELRQLSSRQSIQNIFIINPRKSK